LDSPCLWTTIHVATSASSIITHLERSRGALLDIVIETPLWSRVKHLALVPSLDIVGSLAHRWHSLSVSHVGHVDDDDDEQPSVTALAEFIIKSISHLHFPSLKYDAIPYCNPSLDFLSPVRAPALEHLELEEFIAEHTVFPPVTALKTLNPDFYGSPVDYPSFLYLIPTQTLTNLSLSGFTEAFSLHPNSIHFPCLKMLEISCRANARQFMDAIVAPNLERFIYTSFYSDDAPFVSLRGFLSKFTDVRYLTFYRPKTPTAPELLDADAIALCKTFPGVRHVKLKTNQLPHLFDPTLRPLDGTRELDHLWAAPQMARTQPVLGLAS